MYRIDIDAKRNKMLATDPDKFRKKYSDTLDNINVVFSSPYFYTLEKYKFYLLRRCTKEVLDSKYHYRPDYLSVDKFNTETLWYLLLYLNNIPCIEMFTPYEVLIPSYSSIIELARERIGETIVPLKGNDSTPNSVLQLFTSKIKPKFVPVTTTSTETVSVSEPQAKYWLRQKFNINQSQAENGVIDLAYPVIENTVQLKVQNGGNFTYGVDYTVINSYDDTFRRISWNPSDLTEGTGLIGQIKSGMIIECSYAKNEA